MGPASTQRRVFTHIHIQTYICICVRDSYTIHGKTWHLKGVLVIVEDLLHFESQRQRLFNEGVDVQAWVQEPLPNPQDHRPKVSHLKRPEWKRSKIIKLLDAIEGTGI